jgi:Protein of unknown function (DUF4038)
MNRIRISLLRCAASAALMLGAAGAASAAGPLTVDASGQHFVTQQDQKHVYMAAVGGPEGFLYETDARKQKIVNDLITYGGNGLYMHTIRAFGGDGQSFEHPFNRNDPASGIKAGVFDNWMGYISQLDRNGIVTWIHVLDDTSRPWGCKPPLPAHAKNYIRDLVDKFKSVDHLVWLSGEEFYVGDCSPADDTAMMRAIAAEIRSHDRVHPIGVHHNNGQPMQFGNDPNINVFAQQICGDTRQRSPQGIHAAAQRGDWVYVMAECHPWHRDLMERGDRTQLRKSAWATAMAGGYFMMYDAYECRGNGGGGQLCSKGGAGSPHDPTPDMLRDLRRLRDFMQQVPFATLSPRDDLAASGAQWVLANPSARQYVAYTANATSPLSVKSLPTGSYRLIWFDPVSGRSVEEVRAASQAPFSKPASLGTEVALYLQPSGQTPPSGAFDVVLFDAATDRKVVDLQNGDVIDRSDLTTAGITRLALASTTAPQNTASVRLDLTGAATALRVENSAPYSLYGDSNGDFQGTSLPEGSYTLRLRAYSAANAGGALLADTTLRFTMEP